MVGVCAEEEVSDLGVWQQNYWADLNEVLDASVGLVTGNRKPRPRARMSYPMGRGGINGSPPRLNNLHRAFYEDIRQLEPAGGAEDT